MYEMHVCDLAAIEYRVVGWLARCRAIMDCVRANRDPYINFAPVLYDGHGYTYEGLKAEYDIYQETKGEKGREDFRQNCKPPILGGGFGLGGGELYIDGAGDERRGGLWGYALNVCGIDMEKLLAHKAVRAYRKENWEVVQLWTDMEQGFKHVLRRGGEIRVGEVTWNKREKKWQGVEFNDEQAFVTFSRVRSKVLGDIVRMQLPSGRYLHYLNSRITEVASRVQSFTNEKDGTITKYISAICSECKSRQNIYETRRDGSINPIFALLVDDVPVQLECRKCDLETDWIPRQEEITYDGIEHSATTDSEGKVSKGAHKWGPVKTYGGKLTENAVQAIARDALLNGMMLYEEMGGKIFGVFHDEGAALVKVEFGQLTLEDLRWCMSQAPAWAPTMILDAAGYVGKYYRKG